MAAEQHFSGSYMHLLCCPEHLFQLQLAEMKLQSQPCHSEKLASGISLVPVRHVQIAQAGDGYPKSNHVPWSSKQSPAPGIR